MCLAIICNNFKGEHVILLIPSGQKNFSSAPLFPSLRRAYNQKANSITLSVSFDSTKSVRFNPILAVLTSFNINLLKNAKTGSYTP